MTKKTDRCLPYVLILAGSLVALIGSLVTPIHLGSCILLQQVTTTELPPTAQPANTIEPSLTTPPVVFTASGDPNGKVKTVHLGSLDPNDRFLFDLELTSKGAAIERSTFRDFKNRDPENPQPLVFLSPVRTKDDDTIYSLANRGLVYMEQKQKLRLDRLSWDYLGTQVSDNGAQTATFRALVASNGQDNLELIKTYRVSPETYLLECHIRIKNHSDQSQKVYFDMAGPCGLGREGFRADMRKAVAAFRDESTGQVVSTRLDVRKLKKAKTAQDRELIPKKNNPPLVWVGAINKYFAAVVIPTDDQGQEAGHWIQRKQGVYYDEDGKADSGDETISLDLQTTPLKLAPAGQDASSHHYNFRIYLGPKDKELFDHNETYTQLGLVQTIDFMSCCCPASIIYPLAFFILGLMKVMYTYLIGNYGIVIIILVFFMRLIMHPVTKKSQVSMHKMSKLAPRAEEIKKKYANNKTEMNKQLMALYREQGASPIMGFLPMMIQMPIWIALWSAVNTSIDLRGAGFLPFWITDLSVPDALVRFPTVVIPLLGWKVSSFNLLPILMGVAFYLQQKLMPNQAAAASNPQMAQQQKMMMIMMPIMFPLMLYNVPSGVNLYIMTSTFAGVIEQHVIRKHIREKEEAESKGLVAVTSKTGGKVKKKKPKPMFKQY